ncbi:MAG TPA: hypothetical protein VFU31_27600 [Candidatus Binatia bacterium]|nr:hypothetical protein [Candidatus Binatia bacterium]
MLPELVNPFALSAPALPLIVSAPLVCRLPHDPVSFILELMVRLRLPTFVIASVGGKIAFWIIPSMTALTLPAGQGLALGIQPVEVSLIFAPVGVATTV